jgi:ATP-binding cassette subfamily B (MDR/TAP) protein 1
MIKLPTLALVTLSTIPLVILVQILTQVFCAPLYAAENRAFAEASTNIERATSAISTVKAYNAQSSEVTRFNRLVMKGKTHLRSQAMIWAANIATSEFLMLGTFVSGFWLAQRL